MLNRLRFPAVWLPGLLGLSLALAACGAQPPATPTETAAETPAPAAVENTPTTAAAQAPPTEVAAASATPAQTVVAATQPANCVPVEVPKNDKIAPVTDQDWAKGPATAPVTLIEYGDFQ
jgi:hypothetical protein